MTNTKKTNPKEKPSAEKAISEDKISSQEMPEQATIKTFQTAAKIEKEKVFLIEVAEDIGEGAKKVGEKTAELSDMVVDKLKKGLSQVYAVGAKAIDELSQTAQEYSEKYRAETAIKKLEGEKNKLIAQLGQSIFKHHLAGKGFAESFFNNKEIIDQITQIETLDKKIIKIGKQLDKAKE